MNVQSKCRPYKIIQLQIGLETALFSKLEHFKYTVPVYIFFIFIFMVYQPSWVI